MTTHSGYNLPIESFGPTYLSALELMLPALAFVFGLLFGSFLNVCIYRLPRGLSVVRPRSACPQCATPVASYDNVPVISWLILGGKCRHCKTRITPRYAIVEMICGLMFLASALAFGLSFATLKFCVFSFLMLGLFFTDAETKLLPDAMTIPGFWAGMLFSLVVPLDGILARWISRLDLPLSADLALRAASVADALAGAALGAGFIWLVGELWFRLRGIEAMGFGDVKLMAMVGAFLGPERTLLTIFLASLVGSFAGMSLIPMMWIRRRRRGMKAARAWQSARLVLNSYQMPFGVFLTSMAWLCAFYGERAVRWYTGLYR